MALNLESADINSVRLVFITEKTKWGTCNNRNKTILFNLELAKKPIACIEYVVVHELTHLIERTHNEHFINVLDTNLPKWRSIKDDLNRFILSYQNWNDK